MKKKIGLILIVIGFIILGVDLFNYQAQAHECYGDWCYPTPTIKPTPTVIPCKPKIESFDTIILCPTPTITVSPSPSVTPIASSSATPLPQGSTGESTSPTFAGSSTNAPSASTCTIAFSAPILNGAVAGQSGSLTFNWLESDQNIDKFSIIYGYSNNSLIYGADNIPSSSRSFTINDLTPSKNVFAIIGAWKSGCQEQSNIFDPRVL